MRKCFRLGCQVTAILPEPTHPWHIRAMPTEIVALGEQFIEFRLCEHAAQKWKVAWMVTPSLFHD